MARNRKNQAAAIRFGPVIKVLLLCSLFCGSAVGYVWQKGQVHQLGKQMREAETRLSLLARKNQMLEDQLADLRSPVKLDLCARSLGLFPAQPGQVVRLAETPVTPVAGKNSARRFVAAAAP
jgi:hypothetical protein